MKILIIISLLMVGTCSFGQSIMSDTTFSVDDATFKVKELVDTEGLAIIQFLKNNKIELTDTIQIAGPGGWF